MSLCGEPPGMRRFPALAAAVAVSATLVASIPARASTGWAGSPTLVSGTSRIDSGEWIHTDFVYDDYGADTGDWGQPQVVSLAPTSGDARYPDGAAFLDNAADIVEVRVRAQGSDLQVRVLLETLATASAPAIWVKAGSVETVFTSANADVDVAANTVTFTLVGGAGGDSLSLNLGAGLNDGHGGLRAGVPGTAHASPNEVTTGGSTGNRLFDLAFNTRVIEGRGGAWNEDAQSAALASGDIAQFAQTIDVAALRAGVTTPVPVEKGYSVRLFESRQELGEGVVTGFPQYRGRWQPYALWIPDSYDPQNPQALFLNMHSLSVHHNQYRGGAAQPASYPRFYEQMGDALDAVVITPLGRGPDGWYEDEALIDTMEVWADAKRHYAYDPERMLISGYSMGGYGTYRLTTMMPDAFASAVSVVGPPANGIWAYPLPPTGGAANPDFTYPQLENTRHIPFWITHGAADELVPVAGIQQQADRLAALGHQHGFALHPAEDHLTFSFKDEWSREAGWLAGHGRRVTNPARITYKVRPATWATNGRPAIVSQLRALAAEVGAHLEGAYWLTEVTNAGAGDVTGTVDLTSGGIARREAGSDRILRLGADGPSPYRLTGLGVWFADVPTTDTLSGSLANVSAVTVDVGRAGLSDQPALDIRADRPVIITFTRNGVTVGSATVGG